MTKELDLAKSTAGKNGLVEDLDELLASDLLARLEVPQGAVRRAKTQSCQLNRV